MLDQTSLFGKNDNKKDEPEVHLRLKTKSSLKLSLGEYGRQRTSLKFHD